MQSLWTGSSVRSIYRTTNGVAQMGALTPICSVNSATERSGNAAVIGDFNDPAQIT